MKKKVIIIMACILIFGICFTLGYVIMHPKSKAEKVNNNNQELEENLVQEKDILDEESGESYDLIVRNSRIGIEILKHFEISNIYSYKFYELLDNEGLTDRAKRVWAFIDIVQGKNYVYMLEYSDDGAYTKISQANMKTAVSQIFSDTENFKDGELIYGFKYDEEQKYYMIPAIGIANENNVIVVEVPGEIREYNNRYEVYMYRLYLKQNMEETVDVYGEAKMVTEVYYDSSMTQKACSIEDIGMYGQLDSQVDVLSTYIENGSIDKHVAAKVKYTLLKEGESYKISKYDK